MRRLVVAVAALGAACLVGCSVTTATGFEECRTDVDCGSAAACAHGYCLPLPPGCRRVVGAFDGGGRVPLVALLSLTDADGGVDEAEVQALRAMELAVAEAGGVGVGGRPVALWACDVSRRDEAAAQARTAWVVENLEAPALLTTGLGPTLAAAATPARLEAGVPLLSASATSAALIPLFQARRDVWRVAPPDSLQAAVVAARLAHEYPDAGATRVRVLHEASDEGRAFAAPLTDRLIARGFTNSVQRSFDSAVPGALVATINQLAIDAPQVTVLIAAPAEVRQLVTLGAAAPELQRASGHRWFLTEAARHPSVLDPVTGPELEGAQGVAPAQGAGSGYPFFRDAFTARYGVDPGRFPYAAHGYDATWLALAGLAAASADGGALTGPRVTEGLGRLSNTALVPTVLRGSTWAEVARLLAAGSSLNAEGASGKLDFDLDAGAPATPYELWQVADGGFTTVGFVDP